MIGKPKPGDVWFTVGKFLVQMVSRDSPEALAWDPLRENPRF